MVFNIALLIFGLVILIKSANWLVTGASSLALKLKINPMVIGLTVVAFGTSAPELVVSVTSAISGNTGVAFGNVVGSNIANILLILGISACITPLVVNRNTVWKEIPMSFLGAVVMTVLGIQTILDGHFQKPIALFSQEIIGSLTFSNGIILLLFFVIFIYYTFGIAKTTSSDTLEINTSPLSKSITFIIFGLVGLILGSKLLVDNAVSIATILGVSDNFIGLTVVAVGTSVPELITSIVAAMKKRVELAIGNVVGSNIFNIFFVLGTTSLIREIPLSGQNFFDILVLFGTTLLLFLSLFVFKKGTIGRMEGSIMIFLYLGYVGFLIFQQQLEA